MNTQPAQPMIAIADNPAMRRAAARARRHHPKVKLLSGTSRRFQVKSASREAFYTVEFVVADGKKLASCTDHNGEPCKGLTPQTVCYHVAGAAQCNILAQGFLRQGGAQC